jgi:L-fucose isomerase-like protein
LASALETRAYLSTLGLEARIFHQKAERITARLLLWRRFDEAEEKVSSTRLGLVGKSSSWLVASKIDTESVRKRWGTTVVDVPLSELTQGVADALLTQSRSYVTKFEKGAQQTDRDSAEMQDAAKVFERLLEIVKKHRLDAITVECFDLLAQKHITGCVAMAGLNDTGVTAGCEGDIPSAFTMHMVRVLTGSVSFMGNITDISPEEQTITLAHCTVPTSMTSAYEITSHFESGKSVGIRGIIPEADVTMLRMSGEDLSHYWIAEGRVMENLRNQRSCRTQVKVRLNCPVESVLEGSLGNHHIVIPGRHAQEMVEFLSFCGIRQSTLSPQDHPPSGSIRF